MKKSGSENRLRQFYLRFRVTADERSAVETAARAARQSVSDFLRALALVKPAAGPKPRRRPPTADVLELSRIVAQLGKWGSNLNQLAHQANIGEPVSRAEYLALATQVHEVSQAVIEALGLDP